MGIECWIWYWLHLFLGSCNFVLLDTIPFALCPSWHHTLCTLSFLTPYPLHFVLLDTIPFALCPSWHHTLCTLSFLTPYICCIHHHVVPLARISLTLSSHFSLSLIASGRSSGLHPVSSHSCCMYVWAGRPAFAWPYAEVHRSTSLMSLSLLLQQCLACLVRLAWIVFVMGGRWPYSWCLVGCCYQDLFNIARNILV